ARWDLLPEKRYMWASVQTVRGCPKHCSFCSVWRTDGQEPRQRQVDRVVREVVELRRLGFKFIALADDNFYPVTFEDIAQAKRRADKTRLMELEALREERFALMAQLAQLPDDLVFYTQITMEAAEDPEFLNAMRRAHIRGALVGVESVTQEGLKDVYKGFNLAGDALVARLKAFRRHDIHVLGSFIFGLASDRADTFDATVSLAEQADLTFAQFVLLTPFPGTVDFEKWAGQSENRSHEVDGIPITKHWLIPEHRRPRLYHAHPTMTLEDIRTGTQGAWDRFYSWSNVWARSRVVESLKARVAFVLISKLYRQMYANTGIATDSARVQRSNRWARWMGMAVRRLFLGAPMPELQMPPSPSAVTAE
ncbi:MAG TPA: radical SAM protein, partial [Vicinamibacterales bacterium]|nr:radical SAM protein [Vicinamibacterales bacterium]